MSQIGQSPMIRVQDLNKRYGQFQALRGISFEVPKGQVIGFLGPNGAGKTTTMRIITGYLSATAGGAFVDGIDVSIQPLEARKRIGYLPESNPLYEEMMVLDYLKFVASARGMGKSETQKIRLAVERCGLNDVLGKDIGMLSKGYRQRVGLAQAILHDPDLLVLDEPTSGLDPNQIIEIRDLIRELGQEKTVIMSTHILSEVQYTCSRVLIVNDGQLVADGAPEQLGSQDSGSVTIEVVQKNGADLDATQLQSEFSKLPGIRNVELKNKSKTLNFSIMHGSEDPRRDLFEKIVALDLVLLEMKKKEVSLEETFRKLTVDGGAS